jgi:hypothetical protein
MRTVKERTDSVDLISIEIPQWGCLPLLLLVIFPLAKVLLVVEVQRAKQQVLCTGLASVILGIA